MSSSLSDRPLAAPTPAPSAPLRSIAIALPVMHTAAVNIIA